MEKDMLFKNSQPNCIHQEKQVYQQKRLDILNGFDLTLTRCLNCHKIMELEARKIAKQ